MKKKFALTMIIILLFTPYLKSAEVSGDKGLFKSISSLFTIIVSGAGNLNKKGKKYLEKAVVKLLGTYKESPYSAFCYMMFLNKKKKVVEAVKKYPKNPELLFAMGQLVEMKKKYKKALRYYNKALSYKEKLVNKKFLSLIHYYKGNVYRYTKKFNKAINEYKTALSIYPKFAKAIINIGWIYLNIAKKPEQALPFFLKARKINSRIYQAHLNIAQTYLGRARKIYNNLSASERKKPHSKMDKILKAAWFSTLKAISLLPEQRKNHGYNYLKFAYQMMNPKLRKKLQALAKKHGFNNPME